MPVQVSVSVSASIKFSELLIGEPFAFISKPQAIQAARFKVSETSYLWLESTARGVSNCDSSADVRRASLVNIEFVI